MDRKKTILLVDDDIDYLVQMKAGLEHAGFAVRTAQGRHEAREALSESLPDCAVIDLMMEERDSGFTLAYDIKKKFADIPVIIITSVTNETGMHFDKSSASGKDWIKADMILTKPVRIEQLVKEINRLVP